MHFWWFFQFPVWELFQVWCLYSCMKFLNVNTRAWAPKYILFLNATIYVDTRLVFSSIIETYLCNCSSIVKAVLWFPELFTYVGWVISQSYSVFVEINQLFIEKSIYINAANKLLTHKDRLPAWCLLQNSFVLQSLLLLPSSNQFTRSFTNVLLCLLCKYFWVAGGQKLIVLYVTNPRGMPPYCSHHNSLN